MWVTQVVITDVRQKGRLRDRKQTKLCCQMKDWVLTEFVCMFYHDVSHNCICNHTTALSHSISSTSCALQTQLSHLHIEL
jgi:hypothetical protein